jgi:transcriptional regulator with XRE-family HTH domain
MSGEADGHFAGRLRDEIARAGITIQSLADRTHISASHISNLTAGRRMPSLDIAQQLDNALGCAGELTALAAPPEPETVDLIDRIQASDVSPATLERLDATVFELCCQYPYRDAVELQREARQWLARVGDQVRRNVGLTQHRDLLVTAGWLALLIGCLEYDRGLRARAEATRIGAYQLGSESGHGEIVAWAHEMSAWFALTQGRFSDVVTAAEAGQGSDSAHSVRVQLLAQEAKALGRIGDIAAVHRALDRGAGILASLERPSRPEHHFTVDPDKWYFYAMDAYRLASQYELAETYARQVLAKGAGPDGEHAPMRMAEARLTLGVIAAHSGELDEALSFCGRALESTRRSVPSLLMVAREVDAMLSEQFPRDKRVRREFHDRIRTVC